MMTTITPQEGTTTRVPEVLTEEQHEALHASWALPAYEREEQRERRSRRGLLTGVLVGTVSLAVGFGAGYLVAGQQTTTVTPIVISRQAGPVDANGMTLGRRVAPFDTALPIGVTMGGAVDANGATLGRRVAPFDAMAPTALPVAALTDANGLNLGRRVATFETQAPSALPVAAARDANGATLGRRVAPVEVQAPTEVRAVGDELGVTLNGGRP